MSLRVIQQPHVFAAFLQRFKISSCISTLPVNMRATSADLPRAEPRRPAIRVASGLRACAMREPGGCGPEGGVGGGRRAHARREPQRRRGERRDGGARGAGTGARGAGTWAQGTRGGLSHQSVQRPPSSPRPGPVTPSARAITLAMPSPAATRAPLHHKR